MAALVGNMGRDRPETRAWWKIIGAATRYTGKIPAGYFLLTRQTKQKLPVSGAARIAKGLEPAVGETITSGLEDLAH